MCIYLPSQTEVRRLRCFPEIPRRSLALRRHSNLSQRTPLRQRWRVPLRPIPVPPQVRKNHPPQNYSRQIHTKRNSRTRHRYHLLPTTLCSPLLFRPPSLLATCSRPRNSSPQLTPYLRNRHSLSPRPRLSVSTSSHPHPASTPDPPNFRLLLLGSPRRQPLFPLRSPKQTQTFLAWYRMHVPRPPPSPKRNYRHVLSVPENVHRRRCRLQRSSFSRPP